MIYLFERAEKRIKRNIKKYFPIIIQVIIGVCMLSISINIILSFNKQFNDLEELFSFKYLTISTKITNNVNDNINSEYLEYIKNNFYPISFYKQYSYVEDYKENFSILFANEAFYYELTGSNEFNKSVLIGKYANKILNENYKFKDKNIKKYFDDKKNTLFNIRISDFIILDNINCNFKNLLSDIKYTSNGVEFDSLDNYIIFPYSTIQDLKDLNCRDYITLPFNDKNKNDIVAKAQNIQSYLNNKYTNTSYEVRNYIGEAQSILSRNIELSKVINFVLSFIFLIITFSLIGLLLIFMNKRKKEIAISFLCGASYNQLRLEIFLEIFFIVIVSTLIGNLLSIPFLPIFDGVGVKNTYSIYSMIICAIASILLSTLICTILSQKLKYMSPIKCLKDL